MATLRPTPPTVPTTALTAKTLTALDYAVQMTKQADWLNDAEKRAYSEWKPCALPETCMAEITKHQVCPFLLLIYFSRV